MNQKVIEIDKACQDYFKTNDGIIKSELFKYIQDEVWILGEEQRKGEYTPTEDEFDILVNKTHKVWADYVSNNSLERITND